MNVWNIAVDRLPDAYDEGVEEEAVLKDVDPNSRVKLLCEDYAGNMAMPWYGEVQPGTDYYLSKLHLYIFIVSDMSTGRNVAYCHDQRAMGKGADALCSLRLYHELTAYIRHRDAGTLASRPQILVSVRDNCVGQNKSKAVLSFCTLLTLLFYDRVIVHFLAKGHSHMRPDQVTAWMKRTLARRQLFSPHDLIERFNTVECVDAVYFDDQGTDAVLPFWSGWADLLKAVGIKDIPPLGTHTPT